MSGSVNKVILVGNVGRDPEVRRMQSGEAVVNFSVATSDTWRDKASGERKERTEWHNVVIFNENLAKVAEMYLRKGSKVYLEGALQTRKFTDKNGAERTSTEIVLQKFRGELTLLDSPRDRDDQPAQPQQSPMEQQFRKTVNDTFGRQPQQRPAMALDDDIPFAPEVR